MKASDIDLNSFSEEELRKLYQKIGDRFKFAQGMRTRNAMNKFEIGDRVLFTSGDGRQVVGTITKHNQKTIGVKDDEGQSWRVGPGLLSRIEDAEIVPQRKLVTRSTYLKKYVPNLPNSRLHPTLRFAARG